MVCTDVFCFIVKTIVKMVFLSRVGPNFDFYKCVTMDGTTKTFQ